MNKEKHDTSQSGSFWKFLIPSLIGIGLFMTPVPVDGEVTIPVAILANLLEDTLASVLPAILTIIISLSFIGSLIAILMKKGKPQTFSNTPFVERLLVVGPFWLIVRFVAFVLAIMTFFQIGPEAVYNEYTGGLLLMEGGLLPLLFTVFLFAGLFLPLLLNFGLLELFGSLLTKLMRPLFKLPGRSSIDSLTSWLGDGTIGVLLTSKQYEEGFYSKREAAVIGTTFSVVSITFSLVVIMEVGLEHMFFQFYGTVALAGFIAALIMPRIPPLSRKANTYANGQESQLDESIPKGYNAFSWGFKQAKKRAAQSKGPGEFMKDGGKNVLDMWLGVAPVVMAFGTLALVVAEFTPVFSWLGAPFIPILNLMQIPEAALASEALVVGFADMFLPAIFASGIESELTRFIIACVSVTQLIYLSEVGGVLLGSKIPVKFRDLLIIYLLRTLITLPIITIVAHLIF
ncbi:MULTISPECIES: YjiH family protein [Alteribacter]|uniref:YjiH family protein n=1 Tax=Alteribacter keqinensis TaxID=2483800 RepID=A0A3M7TQI4_9BACI|nr:MULTISPECIES: YjiH family protein [Alteribacter]MBM7095495.1 YjiH family protein [Alteribacter salitolerans]RNA67906.1 YjiH family protein [Alteribacter keqinensis]